MFIFTCFSVSLTTTEGLTTLDFWPDFIPRVNVDVWHMEDAKLGGASLLYQINDIITLLHVVYEYKKTKVIFMVLNLWLVNK